MQKKWFGILLIAFIILFGTSVYSKLADDEKLRLEECPVGTYVEPFGYYLRNYSCYEIKLKENSSHVGINVKCDRFEIHPFYAPDKPTNYLQLDVKRINSTTAILENFMFNKSQFRIVDCFINDTKLINADLYVNLSSIKPTVQEQIGKITTRVDLLENKTEKGKEVDENQTGRIDTIEEELKCENKIGIISLIIGFLTILVKIIFRKDIKEIITKRFWKLVFKNKSFRVLTILVAIAILIINLNLFNSQLSLCEYVDWI